MKHSIQFTIIIIFLTILILGCTKKSDESSNVTLPDDIVYTDISPDTMVTSVRYWTIWPYNLPVPSDSTAGISLDINNDKLSDLQLYVDTWYFNVSFSNPEANFNFSSGLQTINAKDSIAFVGTSGRCDIAKSFQKDSTIDNNSKYTREASIYAIGVSSFCYFVSPSGDTYYGFKIFINGGFNYGWILLSINEESKIVTLKEYAINRTANNPIKAGQKK